MGYELPYCSNLINLNLSYYYKPLYVEIIYTNYFGFLKNNFNECVKCESLETKVINLIKPTYCLTYTNAIKISNFHIIFN